MNYWEDSDEEEVKAKYEPVLKFSYIHPNKTTKHNTSKSSNRTSSNTSIQNGEDRATPTRKKRYSYNDPTDVIKKDSFTKTNKNESSLSKKIVLSPKMKRSSSSKKSSKPILFSECTYEERQEERRKGILHRGGNIEDEFIYYKKMDLPRKSIASPPPLFSRGSYSPNQAGKINKEPSKIHATKYSQSSSFDPTANIQECSKIDQSDISQSCNIIVTVSNDTEYEFSPNNKHLRRKTLSPLFDEPFSRSESPIDFRSRRAKFEQHEKRNMSPINYGTSADTILSKRTATVQPTSVLESKEYQHSYALNDHKVFKSGHKSNDYSPSKIDFNNTTSYSSLSPKQDDYLPTYEYGMVNNSHAKKYSHAQNVVNLSKISTDLALNRKEFISKNSLANNNLRGKSSSSFSPASEIGHIKHDGVERCTSVDGRRRKCYSNTVANIVHKYEGIGKEDPFYHDYYHMKKHIPSRTEIISTPVLEDGFINHFYSETGDGNMYQSNNDSVTNFQTSSHTYKSQNEQKLNTCMSPTTPSSNIDRRIGVASSLNCGNVVEDPSVTLYAGDSWNYGSLISNNTSNNIALNSNTINKTNWIPPIRDSSQGLGYSHSKETVNIRTNSNARPTKLSNSNLIYNETTANKTVLTPRIISPTPIDTNTYYVTTTVTSTKPGITPFYPQNVVKKEKVRKVKPPSSAKHQKTTVHTSNKTEKLRPRSQSADICEMTKRLARESNYNSTTAELSRRYLSPVRATRFDRLTFGARQKCEAYYVNSDQRLLNTFFERLIDQHSEETYRSDIKQKQGIVEQSKFIRDKPKQSTSISSNTNIQMTAIVDPFSTDVTNHNRKSLPSNETLLHESSSYDNNGHDIVLQKNNTNYIAHNQQNTITQSINKVSTNVPTIQIHHNKASFESACNSQTVSPIRYDMIDSKPVKSSSNAYSESYVNPYPPLLNDGEYNYYDNSPSKLPAKESPLEQVCNRKDVTSERTKLTSPIPKQVYSSSKRSSTIYEGFPEQNVLNKRSNSGNTQRKYNIGTVEESTEGTRDNSVINIQTMNRDSLYHSQEPSTYNSNILRFVIDTNGVSDIGYRKQQYLKSLEADKAIPVRYQQDRISSPDPRSVVLQSRRI